MRGDEQVVEFLNEHLTAELTLINQYFLNSKMLEDWGLLGLAHTFREFSFDEMRDTEELIARILFLEGHPNLQRLGTVQVGEDPEEQLRVALDGEYETVDRLRRGVELCTDRGDHGTREVLARMLEEEEGHADFLETQVDLLERLGLELYLANQASHEE